MADLLPRLTLLALVLLYPASGCSDSRHGPGAPVPDPQSLNANAIAAWGHVPVAAPVTSAVPHEVTVWPVAALVDYSSRPIHPSVRLTRSVLRPGESNTPLQRLLEEVVLTRPEADSRISPHVAGPPPGWQVVPLVGRIALAQDPLTGTIVAEAEGLVDVTRRVIWVRATDDAVTPEGSALMRALAHELRHALVYEAALERGATPDQAARESLAIDTPTPSP